MSGRLDRVRGWIRFPAACGSRTHGSNRRAFAPPLSCGFRWAATAGSVTRIIFSHG